MLLQQAKRQPTLTVQYSAKLPTAGPIEGSGQVDHFLKLLGRKGGGSDHKWLACCTLGYALTDNWGIAMEFSGATHTNVATPAVTQNLGAVNYTLKPRLVLDGAVQLRMNGNVPRLVCMGGFTYSIVDLYHRRR